MEDEIRPKKATLTVYGFNKFLSTKATETQNVLQIEIEPIIGLFATWSLVMCWSSEQVFLWGFLKDSVLEEPKTIPLPNNCTTRNVIKCSIVEFEKEIRLWLLCDDQLWYQQFNHSNDWILFHEHVIDYCHSSKFFCVSHSKGSTVYNTLYQSVDESLGYKKVVSGQHHLMGLSENGTVYCYGSHLHGQCGLGPISQQHIPWTVIEALEGLVIVDIAAGDLHSLFLSNSGDVYACGSNEFHQLGMQGATGYPLPVLDIGHADGLLLAGSRHSLVISDKLHACGWNEWNQIGPLDGLEFKEWPLDYKKVFVGPWQTFFIS